MQMLDRFFGILESAGAVVVNGSPLLRTWIVCDRYGFSENEVVRFAWTDGEYESAVILSEGGIDNGHFDEEGVFVCDDNEGCETRIEFFALQRLGPQMNLVTSDVLKPFSVVALDSISGRIECRHVLGASAQNAFASAAFASPDLEYVLALPGWREEGSGPNDVAYAGENVVDGETVLDQPEVFGKPVFTLGAGDIEAVLSDYSLRVANTNGQSFAAMAADIIDNSGLDCLKVMRAGWAAGNRQDGEKAIANAVKSELVRLGYIEF